ncbi:porin family protein [Puia dinghuensis]|uniref:Outer membrane protein beta-barrel domain-containing protein n=1 Tax=Puia dinghuensis TaxID=1792502 RepID=A0A8J2U8Y0_9BACT|nr:porin family protein [Puia dinghuensis]GGA87327.1 hypothetical protein GCM10011511_08100 [Puia dinghuensis]
MYDPNFEKGVRQKMEGLQFIPSESVWANIENAVASRRRRRMPFFFWRFAVPGIILAGSVGGLFLLVRPVATSSPAKSPVTAASTTAATSTKAAATPATAASTPANVAAATTSRTVTPTGKAISKPASPAAITAAGDRDETVAAVHAATRKRSAVDGKTTIPGRRDRHGKTVDHPDQTTEGDAGDRAITDVEPAVSAATLALPAPYLYQPDRAAQGIAAGIRAANLSAKKTTVAVKTLQKPGRPWEAGFMAGAGLSRLNRLSVSASDVATNATSFVNLNYSSATNRSVSSLATSQSYGGKHYVSDVRSEISYMAGIYLEKPLSDRWSINLGMNLHYYSTRITIGQQVSTYVPASVSLITPTTLSATQSAAVYTAGDQQFYTNRFYFLELPVGLQWKINKSRMLPLFLEGGFSLSRLMGANALLYNSSTGIYYKDANVIQKTQFDVSSALMVGLPFHGIRIQLGPQVQYGLTPLINSSNLGDQHFLYTGIRVVVVPAHK